MSPTTLFYFSGTGNSLAFACRLAERSDGVLVPMTRALTGNAGPVSNRIGLVFPTFAYGLPRTVKDFVARVVLPAGAYILGVASCCGIPGGVLHHLDRALRARGHQLDAGFAVCDPRSSLTEDPAESPIQRLMIAANRGRKPPSSHQRLDEIADHLRFARPHPIEGSGLVVDAMGSVLHRLAAKSFPASAQHFWTTDACSGCGTCTRLCPRANVTLEERRPSWGADCDLCHACIQWCPRQAIQFKDLTSDKPRYHHAEVGVQAMLQR
ncbi:MAG: EFR1 family ferrodoxin [Myxococcales bacterium]